MPRSRENIPEAARPSKPIYQIRFVDDIVPERLKGAEGGFRLYPGADNTYYLSEFSMSAFKRLTSRFDVVRVIPQNRVDIAISFPLESVLHDRPTPEVSEEIVAFALSRRDRNKPYLPIYCGRLRENVRDTFVLDRPGGVRNYRWRWDRRTRHKKPASFAHRFPKLIKRMKDRNTRLVVSLGGGGVLLFAHPSIFKLIEALGARECIKEIWGCSGGAIAGMAYALGADHQLIEQEGYDLYNNKYSIELSPNKLAVLKNLILNQFLPGSGLTLKGFVDIQRSLQDSLARMIQHHKPSLPVYALAYNMNTKRNEALTPSKVPPKIYNGFVHHCAPINAVLASSAIPVVFVPCVIKRGGTPYTYIDGSIFEEVPLTSVYHKWQADRRHGLCKQKKLLIISVNLFPYLSTQQFFGRMLLEKLPVLQLSSVLMRLLDLTRRVRIDEQIKLINADPNALAIEVRLPKLSQYNFLNPLIIPTVIDRARQTFFEQLTEIEEQL